MKKRFGAAVLALGLAACEGPMGPAGEAGKDGATGANGAPGTNGTPGADGAKGEAGPAGEDGTLTIAKIVSCSGAFETSLFLSYQLTIFTTGDRFVTASIAKADGFFVRGARWYRSGTEGTAVLMDSDGIGAKNAGNFVASVDVTKLTATIVVDDDDLAGSPKTDTLTTTCVADPK